MVMVMGGGDHCVGDRGTLGDTVRSGGSCKKTGLGDTYL